jgi:putative peptidoglycan lipid II flippase
VSTVAELLKANATVALGTLASRVTGFIRAILLWVLIDSTLNESFNIANNLPNMLYELVIGGVLTATLIPMFTEFADNKDRKSTDAIVGTALFGITIVTVIVTALSWVIIRLSTLTTPKGVDPGQYRAVTTVFGYLLLPQILFYGITFLSTALLNARGRFRAAAWAPAINNIVVILVLGSLRAKVDSERTFAGAYASHSVIYILGFASTAGIIAMALVLVPAVNRAGVRLKIRPNKSHPAVQRVLRLSKWTVGYTIANQVSLWVMSQLAQSRTGWNIYVLAFLLLQLPIGLLAMSVTTTFGPELARARLAGDKARLVDRFHQGMRVLAALLMPAGAGMCVLARPLVSILLEHGSFFKAEQASLLASTLAAFSIGLFCLGGYLFLLRCFYAHNDTRTPFALNVVENAINIVVALLLFRPFGVAGLAWSVTIAYALTLLLALRSLDNKMGGIRLQELLRNLGRLALAATVTGEAAWLGSRLVGSDSGAGAIPRIIVGTGVGIVVYLATLAFLKAPELRSVRTLGRG